LVDRTNLTLPITTERSLLDGTGPHSEIPNKVLAAPDTDPWMACNSYDYTAQSGVLAGLDKWAFPVGKIGPEHHLAGLLHATAVATLYDQKSILVSDALARWLGFNRTPAIVLEELPPVPRHGVPPGANRTPEKQARIVRCFDPMPGDKTRPSPSLVAYTSRPLNGILASPPYLHNGSVPTIYDLLLPPYQRPREFYVGAREYN